MNAAAQSLNLRVVADMALGLDAHVQERAVKMLRACFAAIDAQGEWKYLITGYGSLPNPSQYWIDWGETSQTLPSMIHVVIRASLLARGTFAGMLKFPADLNQREILGALTDVSRRLNALHWQGIVEREERESMKPGSGASLVHVLLPSRISRGTRESARGAKQRHIGNERNSQQAQSLEQGYRCVSDDRNSGHERMLASPRAPSARTRIQPGIGAAMRQQQAIGFPSDSPEMPGLLEKPGADKSSIRGLNGNGATQTMGTSLDVLYTQVRAVEAAIDEVVLQEEARLMQAVYVARATVVAATHALAAYRKKHARHLARAKSSSC